MSFRSSGKAGRQIGGICARLIVALLLSMLAVLAAPQPARAEIASGTCGTCPWSIDDNGVLTIGAGTLEEIYNRDDWPWDDYRGSIQEVRTTGSVVAGTGTAEMFCNCSALTAADLSGLDTSSDYYMDGMFLGCSSLTSLDASGWNTSHVYYMNSMFEDCSSLSYLNLSGWKTTNLSNVEYMFKNCSSLPSLDIAKWNTSDVENMEEMFRGCSSLTYLDLSSWDTSKVECMDYMFCDCTSLEYLDVSGWNASYASIIGMFDGCSSLTYLDVSGFNSSGITDMRYLFSYCESLVFLDMSDWDTSRVEHMDCMFEGDISLTYLNVAGWDISHLISTSCMFSDCTALETLDLSCKEVCKVQHMSEMFHRCTSLTYLDLSGWCGSFADDMGRMFWGCRSLKTIVVKSTWNFAPCGSLASFDVFTSCTSLVGGNGTVFDGDYTDSEYARPDTPEEPGYFTLAGSTPVDQSGTLEVPETNRGKFIRPGNLTRARTSTTSRFPETWGDKWDGKWDQALSKFRDLNEGYVGGMPIPGLNCTDVDGQECANMVPQGACQMGSYTLISAYCKEASKTEGAQGHQSVIYVYESGAYKTTLVLKGLRKGCHVGALAYSAVQDVVFIADSTTASGSKHVRTLGGSVIREAVAADAYSALVQVGAGYAVSTNPSFLALGPDGGTLFVGDIGHKDKDPNTDRYFKSYMVGYQISNGKFVEVTDRVSLPPRTQGVAFVDARGVTEVVCSCSYGRENSSHLYFAQLKSGVTPSFAVTGWRRVELPNMTEDLIPPSCLSGQIGVVYESASTAYCPTNTAAEALKKRLFPTDRMTSLSAGLLAKAAGRDGSINTESLTTMAELTPAVVDSGACGANAGWSFYDDGLLDISGQGPMEDYESVEDTPWFPYSQDITQVYVGAAITRIGSNAFSWLNSLNEVYVSDLVNARDFEIGAGAFSGDAALEVLSLPGASSFGEGWLPEDADGLEVRTSSDEVAAACDGLAATHVHSFEQIDEVAATCGTDGFIVLHCSCGEERERDVVHATGEHAYVEVECVEPTAQEDGWVRCVCETCGMETVEDLPATGVDLSAFEVSEIPDQPFTGRAVEPKVEVTSDGVVLVSGRDYTVTYENNVEEGAATAIVSGAGSYCGTRAVVFHIVDSEGPQPQEPFFLDADPEDDKNHGAEVDWMGRSGISTGWKVAGGREYRGMQDVTRCDFAAFLYRMADLSDDGARNDSIELSDDEVRDVLAGVSDCTPAKTYHAAEVAWMIDSGISRGWPDKGKDTVSFKPMANVARQDMAAFLYRFADLADDGEQDQSLAMGPETVTFRDVKHGDTANHADEVEWLASVGVTKGWPVGGAYEFRGTRTVARQDMAAFMYRLNTYLEQ